MSRLYLGVTHSSFIIRLKRLHKGYSPYHLIIESISYTYPLDYKSNALPSSVRPHHGINREFAAREMYEINMKAGEETPRMNFEVKGKFAGETPLQNILYFSIIGFLYKRQRAY